MPQSHPNRRDSWPPTIIRLFDEDLNTIPDGDEDIDADIDVDIDSNPFEFFLTSPEDSVPDDEYFSDLSAGIEEATDVPTTPVREISPSSLQRLALPPTTKDVSYLDLAGKGYAVPLSLHDFTLSHAAAKKNARRLPETPPTPVLRPTSPTGSDAPPSAMAPRGRRIVRLGPRGRGKTRSLESPRPHSWREPSPDVWSIPEESEAPGLSADEEAVIVEKEPPKKKKKVHWAI